MAEGRCIHPLVELQAARRPDATAVVDGRRRLSYGELNRRANHLAELLLARDTGVEEFVGVCAERSLEFVVGILAVLKAGACYVPIDPVYPRSRLDQIIDNVGARTVLAQRRFARELPRADVEILPLDDDRAGEGSDRNPELRTAGDRLAYVIHTSGSTGRPKGVAVEHRSVVNLIDFYLDFHRLGPEDRTTHLMRPGFDASVVEIWPMLAAGGAIHVPAENTFMDPARLLRWMAEERITFCDLPTVLAEGVFEQAAPPQLQLRALVTGGDKLRRRPPADFPAPVYDQYGPTENTVITTQGRVEPEGDAAGPLHIGQPIANHRVYILDGAGRPVAPGAVGELHLAGAGVARGYLNRPEETRERFLPDPFAGERGGEPESRMYRSGDLGRLLPDGNIEYVGRVDHQVQIRGFRIELEEVERALAAHPGVREVLVLASQGRDARLTAYCLPSGDRPPDPSALRAFARERLPHYMVPAHTVFLPRWPLTANGKLDRAALPEPSADARGGGSSGGAPRNALEERLVRIWEAVFERRPIGIEDDFFELGGDSLLAARIFAQIEQDLSLELSLALLLEAPTIARLAERARAGGPVARDAGLVPLQGEGSRPPLFFLPGIGGHVLGFRELARQLGSDQPSFGLQDPAFDGDVAPFASVEEMAAHFAALVESVTSGGPFALCGYSFGGKVAIELAGQLRERAAAGPGLLGLLDTPAPGYPRKLALLPRLRSHWRHFRGLGGEGRRRYLAERRANLLGRLGGRTPEYGEGMGVVLTTRMREVIAQHQECDARYSVPRHAGALTLFRAARQPDWPGTSTDDPEMGWGPLVAGPIRLRNIPGGHLEIFRKENLKQLAGELRAELEHTWPDGRAGS